MRKTNKILLILIVAILLLIPTFVKADSFKFTAKPNKTKIKAGEEIEITMGIANIDAGEYGINTLEGKLIYDTNVFEEVKQDNFTSKNNWSITYNDENTVYKGKFLAMILKEGIKKDQTIGIVKLKAKKDAGDVKSVIRISDITTNNGTELIYDEEKQIEIQIGDKVNDFNATPIILAVIGIIAVATIVVIILVVVKSKKKRIIRY